MRPGDLQLKRARKALGEGRHQDAYTACVEAIKRSPNSADAYLILGELARAQNALAQSVDIFRQAQKLDPASPAPLIALAEVYILLNRTSDARAMAEAAAALEPRDAHSLDALGIVFSRLGDHGASAAFFAQATTVSPRQPQYLFNLGCSLKFVGDFDAAEHALRRSIEVAPGFEPSYLALIEMTPQTAQRNFIPALERLFKEATADPVRTLALGHALAKTYEDLGDPESALQWLDRAKAPRRRAKPYEPARDKAIFAAAARTLHGQPAVGAESDRSDRPIFVVGMPRSGTTLTDRILSSHPNVTSVGEAITFPLLVKQMVGDTTPSLMEADTFRRAANLDLNRLGRAYLNTAKSSAGGLRFIDKMPFNFFYVGLIRRALPGAKIICLRRDPIDVCLSNYRLLFSQSSPFHDYAYDLADIARYYVQFDVLMAEARKASPSDRFLELRYEALVADQEAQTRRLLSFCDLEWDARCLKFQENDAGVATASAHQVRSPLFSTSISRWRRYGKGLKPAIRILENAGLLDAEP